MKKQKDLYVQAKNGQTKVITFDMYCKQQHSKLTDKKPYEFWLIQNKGQLKEKWESIHKEVSTYIKKKQKDKSMNRQIANAILVLLGSFVCGVAYFIVSN
jgi:hypothetical protein